MIPEVNVWFQVLAVCNLFGIAVSISILDERYMGCWADGGGRRSLHQRTGEGDGGPLACMKACRTNDHSFAGLQNGKECWCGYEFQKRGPSMSCYRGMGCTSDKTNICGWAWTNSVYKACPWNKYGKNCENDCPECGNKGCLVDGTCQTYCPPGFYGDNCQFPCPKGKFGVDCKRDCDYCMDRNCDGAIGFCIDGCAKNNTHGPWCQGCAGASRPKENPRVPCPMCGHCKDSVCAGESPGCVYMCPKYWQGTVCQACDSGLWGKRCENKCQPADCLTPECHMETGWCVACQEGKFGERCENNCPEGCLKGCDVVAGNCTECKTGYYGHSCLDKCGECASGTCSVNGTCDGGCKSGYFGEKCDKKCSVNCQTSVCDQITGACDACKDGFHGDACDLPCAETCKDKLCDKTTAECQTACIAGYYTKYCNTTCEGHCKNNLCAMLTGECGFGCQPGYYGKKCTLDCIGTCKDDECDQLNSACPNGCHPGYYQEMCNTSCIGKCRDFVCDREDSSCKDGCEYGYYGEFCDLECPVNCKDGRCDRETRTCLHGCEKYYYGEFCENSCKECLDGACSNGTCEKGCGPGYVGEDCKRTCPNRTFGMGCGTVCHCLDFSGCDFVTGKCGAGCEIGYYLENCSLSGLPPTEEVPGPRVTTIATTTPESPDGGTLGAPGSEGSSTVPIVASVVAVVLVIIIVVVVVVTCQKRKKQRRQEQEDDIYKPGVYPGNKKSGLFWDKPKMFWQIKTLTTLGGTLDTNTAYANFGEGTEFPNEMKADGNGVVDIRNKKPKDVESNDDVGSTKTEDTYTHC